jgi:creatinine amidohydrolase
VAVLSDLADEVRRQGFGGLVIISGHLGNLTAMKTVARAQYESSRFPVLYLFYPGLDEASRDVLERPKSHPGIVHADELETSLILALAPHAVDMSRAVAEYPDFPIDFDVRARYWDDVCSSGVFGDATVASVEKGQRMLEVVEQRIVQLVTGLQREVMP